LLGRIREVRVKSLRELRVRFEPMGPMRPRVYWRKALPLAGEGGRGAPSLSIELRDGAVYITSPDERGGGEIAAGNGAWEEVSDTRAGWARGIRVAVDFAEEFPDAARTQVGIPIIEASTPLLPLSRMASEREPRVPDVEAATRFFSIDQRAAAISASPQVSVAKPVAPLKKAAKAARALRIDRPRAIVLAVLSLCILGLFAARWRLSTRAKKAEHAAAAAPLPSPALAAPPPKEELPPAITSSEIAAPSPTGPSGAARTKQRRAADAIEMGVLSEAAVLYDELAREHPDSAVYREAARITHQQRTAAGRSARAAR
jgi:hypothetical protein